MSLSSAVVVRKGGGPAAPRGRQRSRWALLGENQCFPFDSSSRLESSTMFVLESSQLGLNLFFSCPSIAKANTGYCLEETKSQHQYWTTDPKRRVQRHRTEHTVTLVPSRRQTLRTRTQPLPRSGKPGLLLSATLRRRSHQAVRSHLSPSSKRRAHLRSLRLCACGHGSGSTALFPPSPRRGSRGRPTLARTGAAAMEPPVRGPPGLSDVLAVRGAGPPAERDCLARTGSRAAGGSGAVRRGAGRPLPGACSSPSLVGGRVGCGGCCGRPVTPLFPPLPDPLSVCPQSTDWSEPWLLGLAAFHLLCFLLTCASLQHRRVQVGHFLCMGECTGAPCTAQCLFLRISPLAMCLSMIICDRTC